MANQGAKKRRDDNTKHVRNLFRYIVACNVVYILLRVLIFRSTFTWKHCVGLIVTSACYIFPYQQLAKMAMPAYSDDGELIDGGFDMSTAGVCGYFHDVIYITSFVQLTSIYSDKFWYTYLVIPVFVAFKLSGIFRGLLSGGQEQEREREEDEKTRKKREKLEKKASRTKYVRTR